MISKASNIILCSKNKFDKTKTSNSCYLPVDEKDGLLDPNSILDNLGNEGITKILIEGGKSLSSSFLQNDLVDEVYLYTSNDNLDNATLTTPFNIDGNWDIIKEESFINDSLIVVRKKELCLQVS